jgi:putative thiamine transport system ATP-binding protein
MLHIQQADIRFGDRRLFEPLTLSIAKNEICTIIAPSGVGKSSLLRWIAGLKSENMTAQGDVFLDQKMITHLPAEKRNIGLIFQTPLLFPHMTVGDNLGFGMAAQAKIKDSDKTRQHLISEALERAGLGGMEHRDPETLSGGQKARVALIRTLLAEPQALLLDEPFSSLDGAMREQMLALIQSESQRLSLPVLLVSHDPRDHHLGDAPPVFLKPSVS